MALDFKVPIAKWLNRNGVIEEEQTSPVEGKGDARVKLDAAASASLRSGKARPDARPAVAPRSGRRSAPRRPRRARPPVQQPAVK